MTKDTRSAFLRELAKHEPEIARAFEAAVQTARNATFLRIVEEAIERGDTEFAIQVLARADYFRAPLDQAILETFFAGGAYQANLVPKVRGNSAPQLLARFDRLNQRGIDAARRLAAELVTEITNDQRLLVRETLIEGLEDNRSTTQRARDLIGRKVGNTRRGGLIGLHSKDATAVRAARRELQAGNYSSYLSRSSNVRNLNIDRSVQKAMRDGTRLTSAQIERSIQAYSDGLLRLRAQTISRTEGHKAMNAGRREAIQQQIDSGLIREDLITKTWVATRGRFTRDHHRELDGTAVKWRESFVSPETGAVMEGPHDPTAPAVDVVNCRCTMRVDVDYLAMAE